MSPWRTRAIHKLIRHLGRHPLLLSVQFEPPVRNSGIGGGKFLERQRVYKPESEEIYTYQARGLRAGSVLCNCQPGAARV
jgi:hypothetical protein